MQFHGLVLGIVQRKVQVMKVSDFLEAEHHLVKQLWQGAMPDHEIRHLEQCVVAT